MKFCLLGVENARDIHKNKVMKANFNKVARFLQLRKIILLWTVEALDKGLSECEVSDSLLDDQLADLCELPPLYKLCEVQSRHILKLSISEGVVQLIHIISKIKGVQYNRGTSSVQSRAWSKNEAHYQLI